MGYEDQTRYAVEEPKTGRVKMFWINQQVNGIESYRRRSKGGWDSCLGRLGCL